MTQKLKEIAELLYNDVELYDILDNFNQYMLPKHVAWEKYINKSDEIKLVKLSVELNPGEYYRSKFSREYYFIVNKDVNVANMRKDFYEMFFYIDERKLFCLNITEPNLLMWSIDELDIYNLSMKESISLAKNIQYNREITVDRNEIPYKKENDMYHEFVYLLISDAKDRYIKENIEEEETD